MPWPKKLTKQIIGPLPLSFETGEQTQTKLYPNYDFQIDKIRAIVTKAIAADTAGTLTVNIGATTIATISFPAGSALNSEFSATGSKLGYHQGKYVKLTTAKATTLGGKILVTLEVTRLI